MRNKKLLSWVLMLTLVLSAIVLTPLTAFAIDPVTIYADSANGNDFNDGLSVDTAVKTLGKAFLLVDEPGQSYVMVLADGDYASPGLVNIPAGASVSVTAADSEGNVKIYINPDTPTVNRIIEFNASAFLSVSFENITFTGDDPATTELIEKSGEGAYLYSCDRVGGNTIAFKSCVFENLTYGINQEYSESISIIVRDSDIAAKYPISMDYGRSLTVDNSVLEMSEGEYWNSVINLNGGPIDVQITNNTLIGNNGAGRGIYEDVYSGTISGNIFKDLDIAIEADVHSLMVSDNIIETSQNGLDLEVEDTNFTVSVINNTIVNKMLKTSGKEGISLYNDDDYITAGTFVVQDNKIINFYTGLDYYDSTDAVISFTLGGTGHGNSFWGNVVNIDWDPDWAHDVETKLDVKGNDWGTTDHTEAYDRIYADGLTPSSVFIFDESLSTGMIATAYVDSNYTTTSAGVHAFGVDAFSSIMDALPYVRTGGQIQVADGSYVAPVWIDRPVHIKGLGDNVNLSKHSSLTAYGNTTTTITAPDVILEKLNFSNGDMGILFNQFSQNAYSSYPDSYKILDCSFTDFMQTAIYEPGYTIYGYETVPGSNTEIRNNIITRTTDEPNGYGISLANQSESLYFSNNNLSGDYNYGISLDGQNIYATGNSITVYSTYSEMALSITNTKNLECKDNVISNSATVSNNLATTGLFLTFNDTTGPYVKEIYRNHIHGFNSGAMLSGNESSEMFNITIGGITSNANDFSDNEFGLTSLLSNFNSEPTNATYNIWGITEDLLSTYIKGSHYSADYQPVSYLPTATITLSDDATLSALLASGITLTPTFDSATIGYTTNVSNSISSTTVSAVTSDNSATVTINGTAGSSKAVSLNVGSNTFTVIVIAEDGTTTKTYTIEINRAASTGGGGGGTPTVTGTEIIVSTSDGLTNVKGNFVETEDETKTVIMNDAFRELDDANQPISINAQLATIKFDKKAIDTIGASAGSGDVMLIVRKVESSKLSDKDRVLVGSWPVYELAVTKGGKTISDFKGGHAKVTIPYALKTSVNPNVMVIYYLSDGGKLIAVRGHYDATSKAVVFKTTHFSKFVIGYNPVNFSDVADRAWYKNAIEFIAARGITSGTGNNNFSPDAKLTRGQFVVLLMNAYGISSERAKEFDHIGQFNDAGNTYYTDYLLAAKGLGIVNGIGNNLFAPEKEITRQEMFVMLYNALKVIDEVTADLNNVQLSAFNDATNVADWANEALSSLVKAGVVVGNNNNLYPTSNTTRAEIAQVLYNLLSK